MKYFEKRKLVKFLENLNNPNAKFPDGYLEYHKDRIDWLKWLIKSYEYNGNLQKKLLESLINYNLNNYDHYVNEMAYFNITPLSEVESLKKIIEHIKFIYYWVHHKRITGF